MSPKPPSDDRERPDRETRVRAEVVADGEQTFGDVIELNLRGVTVEMTPQQKPAVVAGHGVRLTLHLENLRPLETQAVCQERTEHEGFTRFEFVFAEGSDLRSKLPADLVQSLNERNAFRVEPQGVVFGALRPHESELQLSVRLRDLSADGCSMFIDRDDEAKLFEVDEVDVEFSLPHREQPMAFRAQICSRYTWDEQPVLGLYFRASETSDFPSKQRAISEYVMDRQREWLRARVGR